MKRVYALNAHASFACQRSGACCTAGWAIPVEANKRTVIPVEWLTPDDSGACPQFDRSSRLCRVHRDHGEPQLPESCRHFPRRALIDDRGTFVTLSHFCPTASRLLVGHPAPLAVVALNADTDRTYEGLDASGEWPPLLRPGVLFDYPSFEEWLAFAIDTLGNTSGPVEALMQVAAVAERVRSWNIERGPLSEWTVASLSRPVEDEALREAANRYTQLSRHQRYERVCATVPAGLHPPEPLSDVERTASRWLADLWQTNAQPAGRYLAAKTFAAWTPYQSHGLRTHVAELFAAEAVLFVEATRICARRDSPLDTDGWVEAIRASDWLLMHLSDRAALMASLEDFER